MTGYPTIAPSHSFVAASLLSARFSVGCLRKWCVSASRKVWSAGGQYYLSHQTLDTDHGGIQEGDAFSYDAENDVYRDYKLHIDFNIDFEQFSLGIDLDAIAA